MYGSGGVPGGSGGSKPHSIISKIFELLTERVARSGVLHCMEGGGSGGSKFRSIVSKRFDLLTERVPRSGVLHCMEGGGSGDSKSRSIISKRFELLIDDLVGGRHISRHTKYCIISILA